MHKEELHDLYCSAGIVWVVLSERMDEVCGVSGKGRGWRNVRKSGQLEDSGVVEGIILK